MTFSDWVQKWINQMAHVGWGAYLVMVLGLHISHVWALLAVLGFAGIKEAVFDPLTETKTEQGSGIEDWLFWALGALIGFLSLIVR